MADAGYVYILTNPSFKEDWVKIGKSSRPVDVRSKELDNTAVPLPFEIYATLKTVKYQQVEKQLHKMIDELTDLRVRARREFFNIAPGNALKLLKICASTLEDAEIDEVHLHNTQGKGDAATDNALQGRRRPPFRFSMVNIPAGATIVFEPTGLELRVSDDSHVEYEGQLYKLSPFASKFMPESKRNASNSYCGPDWFSYNGELLSDLRNKSEQQ